MFFQGYSSLTFFTPVTENEIRKIIAKSSDASCDLDPMPTSFIKQHINVLAPVITDMVNSSLQNGKFPQSFKHANIIPLLKKDGLDPDSLKNYRPVSNLPFVSKITEQVVADRLKAHLEKNSLWGKKQSACRAFHSTETALLRVHSDITKAIDDKKMVALVLLDLSAAFDTINHKILLQRLSSQFGICGTALQWFSSYLQNRTQQVKINGTNSDKVETTMGVPQGSVLGPILFTLYVSPVADIARNFNVENMFYADDSQLYVGINPRNDVSVSASIANLEKCIEQIKIWMQLNFLKLNDSKTEYIIFGSSYSHKICPDIVVKVGNSVIKPATTVRNLGAFMDKLLNMDSFVKSKAKSIHYQLRKMFRIRKYLTDDACKTLVQAIITSRLDYSCALFHGLNKYHLTQLQRLQDTAARLVCKAARYDSAEPLREKLHWLPVKFRIKFRIVTYVFKSVQNQTPMFISELLTEDKPVRTLRSNDSLKFKVPRTITKAGEKGFHYAGPMIWNGLPNSIKTASSIITFKRLLKTFYFKIAYNL